ncbi:GFA family protein [Roseovarius atlanticus]|uniref:GFA family protein n=1 Tax=Roseovarius atlanticus TaxID=1641875 RepID=UPI001C947815|nr:GFA family protein [Roseovarius atlanticus]MBY5986705.1 GFA family protein [Roseovarius atlanticus]MBY6125345.1 GFA family protein [Roseovarius atlanticus]MBY6150194.1 GFA family protein [Roseovarius atlanticus]
MITGSCLCGANAFELDRAAGPVTACHCGQCRKYSGFHAASVDVDDVPLRWVRQGYVTRFVHESGAVRAFCGRCGTKLWFEDPDGWTSLEAGLIDAPSGGAMAGHIFVADRGDYYDIADGLPQAGQA